MSVRKRLSLLLALLICAAASPTDGTSSATMIELGLYEGSTAGPMLMNATTTIATSKGQVLLSANGAWPHGTLVLAPDVYTITVSVPASGDSAAIQYSILAPLATQLPASMFTISNITGKIAFNSSGEHGQFQLYESGLF